MQDDPTFPTLLDGAVSALDTVAEDLEWCRRIAGDPSRPLDERLEAYEDLIASEVGDTRLLRARNIEREQGVRQLFLKFEGGNPTGTQKDRIAFAQVHDALRRGFDTVTVATCGNYGAAVAFAATLAGMRCLIHIPESYTTRRLDEMVKAGAEICRVPGDYEAAVRASKEAAAKGELYDANPGGANTILQLVAYGEIANEIYDELRDAPAAIAVSVSNGTTLAGIHRGFATLYRRGKTSRVPRIIAGSSHGKNPIVHSFLKGFDECRDLDPAAVKETEVNEPLINWHSFDGDWALEAVRTSGGFAENASDKEMLKQARVLRDREGLSVLPASTAGLAVMLQQHARSPFPGDRYVAVLTGRR
ncbi:MAG: pyridoxal-phosphate dependent enzyme [Candidatus Palauibacterales bacterium]|nr:pyridoxal-phosphate dependent enzyme [Candidatus Palauibacterales bacterium]MDP2483190.1 pyridoxal-phosphate dependent enzyme [Candidatus Palauibacterales bacterium]